ncbi:hypothetical protein PG993_014871 [Apiospora rasikravindrae]|uniref:Uncharacterized protein n=1 Tax=Apiospora rasikravindrae TaxID=990691 RepID=A0ABR1RP74_9PEZI
MIGKRLVQNRETLVETVGELIAKLGRPSENRLVYREGAESSRHIDQPLEDVPGLGVLLQIAHDLSSLVAHVDLRHRAAHQHVHDLDQTRQRAAVVKVVIEVAA